MSVVSQAQYLNTILFFAKKKKKKLTPQRLCEILWVVDNLYNDEKTIFEYRQHETYPCPINVLVLVSKYKYLSQNGYFDFVSLDSDTLKLVFKIKRFWSAREPDLILPGSTKLWSITENITNLFIECKNIGLGYLSVMQTTPHKDPMIDWRHGPQNLYDFLDMQFKSFLG